MIRQVTSDKSCHNRGQVIRDNQSRCQAIACRVITHQLLSDTYRCMSSINITSMYMASDRIIVEHNQAKLSKLEAWTVNSV